MLQNLENTKTLNGCHIQILHLKKGESTIKNKNEQNNSIINKEKEIDNSFKINKMSYFDIKLKKYKFFGFGKVNIKYSQSDNDNISLYFYDSSLHLRFQGFINKKITTFSLESNKNYVVIINKIIGLVNNNDEDLINNKQDKILTYLHLYFNNQNDVDQFLDCLKYI